MDLGVRTWGDRPDGGTVLLIGTYQMRGEIGGRLLDALPPLLSLTADVWDCPLTPLLTEEVVRDAPGQEVVLDRLLDLLVITALRAWFARPEAQPPAWYRARADPVVGPVLRLLQDHPAHPWTVAALAAKAGGSRAALARRFTGKAPSGEPPMTYLTGWRLALAADRLRDTDDTIGAIARQVGYGSAFALSTAFKRTYGVNPQDGGRGRPRPSGRASARSDDSPAQPDGRPGRPLSVTVGDRRDLGRRTGAQWHRGDE
ncbi:hypothetical protein SVIOM342S_05057 [Streptomyces violaceorubidus]